MPFELRVEQIELSDNSVVDLLPTGVTAFVGPNNAGKSRLLREIQSALRSDEPRVVVRNVTVHREASTEEFEEWMDQAATRRFTGNSDQWFLEGSSTAVQHAHTWFQQGPPLGNNVSNFFVRLLDAESRLSLASPAASFNALVDPPATALQQVFLDKALEERLSDSFREAFRTGVVLNRLGGGRISLHTGDPMDAALGDPLTYLQQIEARPQVSEQGDGMRSYLGILLAALASPWPVLLIDEPEAFLHPPQARALGRQLSEIAGGVRQVVIATHSADIVRGLLDGPAGSVSLNRLTRDGTQNHVATLPADELHAMWSDPLLRYSNLIDGLFHPCAVVCESDADCRFYEAVLQSLVQTGAVPPRDWLFAHCGGKHRMPRVVSALRSAGVPVRVIADIDIFREAQPISSLMTLCGLDPAALVAEHSAVRSAVEAQQPQNPMGYVRDQLDALLDAHVGGSMTPELQGKIRDATKSADGWSNLKRGGLGWLPQGDATAACNRLLDELFAVGIHVVPVGELERWDAEVAGHGPAWTTAALTKGAHEVQGSPVWEFIKAMALAPDV